MIIVQSQTNLLQVVAALHAPRGLPRSLNSRKQQADKNPDDRYHDQQLNQSEAPQFPLYPFHWMLPLKNEWF
jgi:hypothetical protein